MEYDDYDDDAYDDDDYNDNIYDTKTIDKLVEECDYEQHLLWDTFLSLTSHTCVGHQMDQLVRTTTPPPTIQTGWTYISWGGPLYNIG